MFFKPKWYEMLPVSVKPIEEEVIKKIEGFRKEHAMFTDEITFWVIMSSRWAVKRIQEYCLEEGKKLMPNASEKELWLGVLLSRLDVKLKSLIRETEGVGDLFVDHFAFGTPLSQKEILSRIENASNIVSNFRSFDDVVDYIIAMDEEENQFYDPTGRRDELNDLLYSKQEKERKPMGFLKGFFSNPWKKIDPEWRFRDRIKDIIGISEFSKLDGLMRFYHVLDKDFFRLGTFSESPDDYKIELFVIFLTNWANFLIQDGCIKDAEFVLRTLLKLFPEAPAAHISLLGILVQTGRIKEAAEEARVALKAIDVLESRNLGIPIPVEFGDITEVRQGIYEIIRAIGKV